MRRLLLTLACALGLPACATVTTGTTQSLSVITDPPGAACRLERGGSAIGIVNPTPGTVQVSRSMHDIQVQCRRPGYQPALATVSSQFEPLFLGNILIGGLIGMGIDIASGAGAYYEPSATIVLQRDAPAPDSPGLPGAATPPMASGAQPVPAVLTRAVPPAVWEDPASLGVAVAEVRSSCERARRRDCDGEVQAFLRAVEDQRQRAIEERLGRSHAF